MRAGEGHAVRVGGAELQARLYRPEGPPRAAVVILGALAAPQRYLRGFATRLAGEGYGVLTFDYPGVGDSRAAGSPRTNLDDWAAACHEAARATRALFPSGPLLAVCHSIGGMLYGFGGVQADGAVLVASTHGVPRHYRGRGRLRVEAAYRVLPLLALPRGWLPGWRLALGAEVPRDAVRHWGRWGRQARFSTWSGAPGRFAEVRAPLLSVSVEDDDYAPVPAVDALARQYSRAPVLREHVAVGTGKPVGHFGLLRGGLDDVAWGRWLAWLRRVEQEPYGDGPRESVTASEA
ncbi:MAG: alpha/beta hydrolase [Planctomycetes bacterium]|nr:alpha/beta hydrolase [Planctomycetota bacterium]